MWDLWWTKWPWGRFSPSTSVSPANSHSTECSIDIIIYHLGLVQYAKQWSQYQVPHEENNRLTLHVPSVENVILFKELYT
jgi:hypothetical protein